MRQFLLLIMIVGLAGCASTTSKRSTYNEMNREMEQAALSYVKPAQPDAVAAALLPPINIALPQQSKPLEERFSLTFNNVPAVQFFNAIVSGTHYNMLLNPDVNGMISANLKNVTLFEALDAVREMYGYDYKVEGSRIYIKPLTMQTSIFQVNYLTGSRKGTSDTSVISGSLNASQSSNNNNNGYGNNNNNNFNNNNNGNRNGGNNETVESSRVRTTSDSDFWKELKAALDAIVVAGKDGRSVVVSPQSGVVVVRAMPDELKNVAAYLKATQLSVDRQVILEAKILEVSLSDGYQSGINWSALHGNTRVAGGFAATGQGASITNQIGNVPATGLTDQAMTGSGFFGLALQTRNFAGLISFLESQGNVHVLSSPRIATLNNQKAVLKIGTDEFFVTNVSNNINTAATGNVSTSTPNVTLEPFVSGVVLDVTPQIDSQGNIILHIHPSVTDVQESVKTIDLGSQGGLDNVLKLPLAKSNTSETDSVVRAQDGNIIALGGLMRQKTVSDRSQIPGAGDVPVLGNLVKNVNQVTEKRELVILLKPTVIQNADSWSQDVLDTQKRIESMAPRDHYPR